MLKKDITIITVCFNVGEKIIDTIEQVVKQNIENIEHLIVDGKSSDNTVEIIKQYSEKYKHIKFISESDNGIYDAMNKGIDLATGNIIYFLNVGDQFYDNNVIKSILDKIDNNDVIYGNTFCKYDDKLEVVRNHRIDKLFFITEKNICHQSMFIKKSAFDNIGKFYYKQFKYCADYDWLMRCYCKNLNIGYIDKNIVYYDMNGVSAQKSNRNKLMQERESSIKNNLGKINYLLIKIKHKLGKIKRLLNISQ